MEDGRPARILHLFDEVCNLVNDQGEVLSLVAPTVGPGPFTMVMEGDFQRQLSSIDLQQPITVDKGKQSLSIGPLIISTGGAPIWNATPKWSRLRIERGKSWPASTPLPIPIETQLEHLLLGIDKEDLSVAAAASTALAGLGGGLTPAGDDVMLGVLFALWIWLPKQAWIDLIVESAAPRTTTLSAAFLRAAAAGEATVHWHDLVDGRQDAPANILAIGHNSGSDAWAGFSRAKEKFS
jgi:hypothetical protein